MAINPVAGENSYLFKNQTVSTKPAEATAKPKEIEKVTTDIPATKPNQDVIEKTETPPVNVTYPKPEKAYKMDHDEVAKLMNDSERRLQNFQDLLQGLMQNQSGTYKVFMLGREFNVDQKTVDKAKADLEPGGDQSVQVVADRIVAMAKALTGGDPSKVEEMKAAAIKGFELAEKAWGGKLPDISQQTHTEVMRQFSAWAGMTAQ